MSVFDNKLINYGNLAEFHSKIIDDSSVSTIATWSSQLINNELADKQDVLTAGAGIDISNGVISATGGGGSSDAIEEVSELPDASENKDKLFRLASDDNVYVSELKSRTSTTTNRLPDEQQVDKAYIINNGNICYYKGEYKIICADGEISGFGWLWYTPQEWTFVLTKVNAVNASENTLATFAYSNDEGEPIVNQINNTITTSVSKDYYGYDKLVDVDSKIIPATYNAPESAQIGNAYIIDNTDYYNWIYNGSAVTITIDGEQITGYKWLSEDVPNDYLLTVNQASNLYYYNDYDNDDCYKDFTLYRVSNGSVDTEGISSMYIPQLNAPDSEQLNVAYAYNDNIQGEIVTKAVYKGAVEGHFIDGNLTVYQWEREDDGYNYFTKYPAYQQYSISYFHKIPVLSLGCDEDSLELYWDSEREGYYSSQLTVSQAESMFSDVITDFLDKLYIVKYQRTEVTEEWDWQPLTDNATNDDIDLMFASEIKLIRAQEDDENYIDWLVNTSGETMEFNGQIYYKWVVWANDFNDGSGPAVEHPDMLVLTNTLDIQLPFNSDSPEFEYRISIYGEEMESQDYIHGDYTQKTVQ